MNNLTSFASQIMNNNIGLFIKTCAKDHQWLKWCLLSIQQNAIDFNGVCIVTDSDHKHIHEYDLILKSINATVNYVDIPTVHHTCQDGIGYLWMQNIKLTWQQFCTYDAVVQIDSDCVISSILTPQYFIDHGKYLWFVRNWVNAKHGAVHRQPLQKLLMQEPMYEHMPYNGWLLNRSDTEAFHEWILSTHHCTWWDYLLNRTQSDWGKTIVDANLKSYGCGGRSRGSSIYNAYGGFIELLQQKQQNHQYIFMDIDDNPIEDHPIEQYWSWGGLDQTTSTHIEQQLHSTSIEHIMGSLEELSNFDDNFYIMQQPSAYRWLKLLPDSLKLNNKQKLFYHYKVFNKSNKQLYLNRYDYEYSFFDNMSVDTDFDHVFYAEQYPETSNYFSTAPGLISERKKLYHHYLNYGIKHQPPLCKNKLELAKKLTKIMEPIPEWFTDHAYLSLCPEAQDYFLPQWKNIPLIYRLFHHYLNYGQNNYEILKNLQQ